MATEEKVLTMIPGTLCQGKTNAAWLFPQTTLCFGETQLEGKTTFFNRINLLSKHIYRIYYRPINYSDIKRVEYCTGSREKDTLQIITNDINGSFFFSVTACAQASLADIKKLLEACAEQGRFGEAARDAATAMQPAMEQAKKTHAVISGVSILIAVLLWLFLPIDAGIICYVVFGVFGYLNAKAFGKRWLTLTVLALLLLMFVVSVTL